MDVLDQIITGGIDLIVDNFTEIKNFLVDIKNFLVDIISYLNPFSDNFFLKIAFIPSDGFLENYANEYRLALNGKFPLISDLFTFFNNIAGIATEGIECPEFKITLPGGKWGTGSYSIIDFSMFAEFREYILAFMRCIMWFFFAKNTYRSLSNRIYK